jgi:putative membrane-bound dehydrogenase-like protein
MSRIIPLVCTLMFSFSLPSLQAEVAFEKQEGSLNITVDGKPFAVYVWNDPKTTRPYFKQVHAAGGEVLITRNHPPGPDDIQDHATFHPGIWWGFGDVGGNDYWRMKARVVGGEFVEEPKGGKDFGRFTVRDKLLVNGGDQVFCEQICRYTIMPRPAGILLLCETALSREEGEFWLGDQEEMGLAIRVAKSIATVTGQGGRILNSDKSTDLNQIRTRQSDWCDYSGPVGGGHGGILLMNNPGNFRKPWWHAVDTGLNIANPLGESELNGRGKKRRNVLVKAGESLRLSYGALVHQHAKAEAFDPTAAYADFLNVLPTIEEKPKPKKVSQADLPIVPDGFRVSIFAQEPMVYKPTSMCFDAKGRLFVGQGPQYPENYENSPTDSVYVFIDSNHDGVADKAQEFARGFNSVQGLAWRGNDLYVANSPELTVVRDLDGDDVADEYVVVFTDLGNREHALHGLNWGPDGKLYMSKGNSKGHNQPEKYGYVAPRPFRDLWDVEHPAGAPDKYPPRTFTKENYRKTYHYWDDDWGREGGVLRCDPLGENLEIVTRGLRNPWDITMDPGFNWLGTDNDQSQGDRIVMPFFGAHFGWGHPYSSHWSGDKNLPTVPVSGPMFPGSGAGIVYYDHEHFPPAYRQVFILNDWLDGTFIYRPTWEGALMQPEGGTLQPFIRRGSGSLLYRPTDLEFGPDGSIYICGWGGNYHYERGQEGSWLFRVTHSEAKTDKPGQREAKRSQPVSAWSVDALIEDLGPGVLPVWRVAAQEELVRRGESVRDALIRTIEDGRLNRNQETWSVWALGRMLPSDPAIEAFLVRSASPTQRHSLNLRLQALRVLAHRMRENEGGALPKVFSDAIADAEPRVRFEAVLGIRQAEAQGLVGTLTERLADENDRLVFYAGWGALQKLTSTAERKKLLADQRPRVRLAALLSLQEEYQLTLDEALAMAEKESDVEVQSWALMFAMNPRPPKKMPNTISRIELEQSMPMRELIDRAEKGVDRPVMRKLYLTLISRTPLRGNDTKLLKAFYSTLKSDEERALVLVPLTTSVEAKEDVWEAFRGEEPLQRAAVDCWQRMINLSARSSPASEERRKELGFISDESDRKSNIQVNADMLATWLLEKLAQTGPDDRRVASAVEVLSTTNLSPGWKPPAAADATLAAILEQQRETLIRSRVLMFVGKLGPSRVPQQSRLRDVLRTLCVQPDPRLYLSLINLSKQLGMDVVIPKLEVATRDGVLSRLTGADVNRGRHLFFESSDGIGCASCHRVAGRGNDFAPDLSGIGLRAKPETIVESLLTPSAAITEGYSQQTLVTDDGLTIVGVVLRETAAEITLFKSDRTQQTIRAQTVVERQKSKVSAMPDGYGLYGNEQIADLVAYLLTLRHNSSRPDGQSSGTKGD